ncbi:hypothetical protein [Streptomyces neyagawaensis]|uniref:Uncharacterized protein n=1 Tax=Streptomyces neyagawaensis TaxID=42238 RepID=A0ABV3AYW9_9ACTN
MLVVEISRLAVAAINPLLQRLDRRVDEVRKRPDVAHALIELHRVIKSWATAAEGLNQSYEAWVRCGAAGSFDDFDSYDSQVAYAKFFRDLTGDTQFKPDAPPPSFEVLSIYAPELTSDLKMVTEHRLQRLDEFNDVMHEYSRNVTTLRPGDLAKTAADLKSAAESLRRFIVENFPIHSL